jgi:hypothetical protein
VTAGKRHLTTLNNCTHRAGANTQQLQHNGLQNPLLVRLRYAQTPAYPAQKVVKKKEIEILTHLPTGVAVRLWQLGIEMRPFFYRQGLFAYPIYGLVGASFGYWLQGMEDNQMRYLGETRDRLIEKRRRRAEREGGLNSGTAAQKLGEGLFASPKVVVDTDGTREITSAAQ